MPLSQEQERARKSVLVALASCKRVVVLVGPAGTGKTTLLRTIAEDADARGVVLIAPTGKAASRLREKSGRFTSTIHKALYREVGEDKEGNPTFGKPSWPCLPGQLVICDEASMVGRTIAKELEANLPPGAQILYCGDREQLPPVEEGGWGVDFDRPDAALLEPHRQALESPIIRLATEVREGRVEDLRDARHLFDSEGCVLRKVFAKEAARWIAERREAGVDATLLAWRNKTRRQLNASAREARGLNADFPEAGDVLVCLANNYAADVYNGETFVVDSAVRPPGAPWPCAAVTLEGRPLLWTRTDLVGVDDAGSRWREFTKKLDEGSSPWDGKPSDEWVFSDVGECLTVHKSQGSEWDEVGFVVDGAMRWFAGDDPETHRRLVYTAITRAAKRLVVFALPR